MESLIQREQTYLLDRKIITIHSEDRDTTRYPMSNMFDIRLPEDLTNVQSIRLVNSVFPSFQYVFSREYQNTKMEFEVVGNISETGNANEKTALTGGATLIFEIEEGFYTPQLLAIEIENKMNEKVTEYLLANGLSELVDDDTLPYSKFSVRYNEVQHKLMFGNSRDPFILFADKKMDYEISCGQKEVWGLPEKWGLAYYLGLEKKQYNSTPKDRLYISYEQPSLWLSPSADAELNKVWSINAPHLLHIMGENAIYMELEGHNSIQELSPYPSKTNSATNAVYSGGGYAFAKIPVTQLAFSVVFDSRNAFLTNIAFYERPIERMRTLKVKFRFHDGRLVDFKNINHSFTLEITCLKDEINRVMSVRKHGTYNV
jgi:hypothetical protein